MDSLGIKSNVKKINFGWVVVFAALFINLALGILYTWSMFSCYFKRLKP